MRMKRSRVIWLGIGLAVALGIGAVALLVYVAEIRPWRPVEQVRVGMDEAEVARRLGAPTAVFATNQELAGTKRNWFFARLAGGRDEPEVGADWRRAARWGPKVRAEELPPIGDGAHWFGVGLSGSVLIYFRDGKVEAVYWAGT